MESKLNFKPYILMQNDFESRLQSRSGGAFVALSNIVLKNDGVVYGCVLTNDLEVRHIRATTQKERDRMRGSKYVQSHLYDIFHQVKSDLKKGALVMFTGTACQVAGLYAYLGNDSLNEKLFTCDILCHGVPSEKIYNAYIDYIENKNGKKIKSINFRNKLKYGWSNHIETVEYMDGLTEDMYIFSRFFYTESIMRCSCHNCPYHSKKRISDITLADAWGALKDQPKMVDDNGLSLVLCNTQKGLDFFKRVEDCTIKEVEFTESYLEGPISRDYYPLYNEKKLWKIFNKKGFEQTYKYIIREDYKNKIINKLRRMLKLSSYNKIYKKSYVNKNDDFFNQQYENMGKKKSNTVLPIIYKKKNECMGCTACYNKCLDIKQAILMKQDSKGFYYPVVDASKCIGCHACEKVCPFENKKYNISNN